MNPFGVDRLHQGEDIVLKYPTEDDMGGGLAMMSGIMYPFAKFILQIFIVSRSFLYVESRPG